MQGEKRSRFRDEEREKRDKKLEGFSLIIADVVNLLLLLIIQMPKRDSDVHRCWLGTKEKKHSSNLL